MYVYNRVKPVGLLLGIFLMVIGIVFLVTPDRVTEFLAVFIGAVITVFGIFRIISVVVRWNVAINRALLLIFGIIILLAGVFMLFNPDTTITLAGAVTGIIAIMLAVDRFITANRFKGSANIVPTVISGLIHLLFGLGMIFSAIVVFSIIIVLVGIYLLVAGFMFTFSALFFHDF